MANFEGFVIRGLLSVFLSRGPERLVGEINQRWPSGVQISDHGWAISYFSNVPWLINQCVDIHRRGKKIVLIGHSFGGTSAIMVNNALSHQKIPVALLCPIDPAFQYPTYILPNAQRVVGFYQNTPGQLGRGIDKEGYGWSNADWNARAVEYRRYETHLQIINDPFVHKHILDEIGKL